MQRKIVLMITALCCFALFCVRAEGALTNGANKYLLNAEWRGSGDPMLDPTYLYMNEVEGIVNPTKGTMTAGKAIVLDSNGRIDSMKFGTDIRLVESDGSTYVTILKAGDQSANLTYTFPIVAPTEGQYLSSTAAGIWSWGTPSATFTGGNITSDCTLSNGVDLLSSTTTAQSASIKVYDTTAVASYTNVLLWTNGAVPDIAMGSDTSTFALNSTTIDVTAGAVTGVTTLDTSGAITSLGTVTGVTVAATGAATVGTTLGVTGISTMANNVVLDDGVTNSPSLVLQDATNQTATFIKVDNGNLTLANGSATQSLQVTTGNVKVGSGTEDVALNGDDAFVTGTAEVDGAARFDGAVTLNSTAAFSGDVTIDDQISGTYASNDEEIAITNTATNLTATSLVTFTMAAQDDQAYILSLAQTPDADADNDFLRLMDNATNVKLEVDQGGTTAWTLDAASAVSIDSDTTNTTVTTGVLDIIAESVTTAAEAVNIKVVSGVGNGEYVSGLEIDLDDDTAAASSLYGINLLATDVTGSATVYGIYFQNTIEQDILAALPAAGVFLTLDAATIDNTVTTGVVDIEFDSITADAEALNIKATQLTGGAGVADAAIELELDADSSNASDILYGLIINATDTTATGKVKGLYVKGAGVDAGVQLDTGYLRIGTGSSPGITPGDDDAFIEGTLEVDGTVQLDGGTLNLGNGVIFSTALDTRLEITENSDTFGLIFGSNKVELASCNGTGITTIDANTFTIEDLGSVAFTNGLSMNNSPDTRLEITENSDTFGLIFGSNVIELASCNGTGITSVDFNDVDQLVDVEYLTGDNGQQIGFSANERFEFTDTENIGFTLGTSNTVELTTNSGVTTLDTNDVDNINDVESIQYDDDALSKLMCKTIQLNAAEVNALAASPKELVAAPGVDYMIWPIEAVLILDAGSEVLAETADNLVIGWNNGAVVTGETIETTGFIDQAADTITNWHNAKDEINAASTVVNKNLSLKNASGEFTGNTSNDAAMTVTIFYRIVKVGL